MQNEPCFRYARIVAQFEYSHIDEYHKKVSGNTETGEFRKLQFLPHEITLFRMRNGEDRYVAAFRRLGLTARGDVCVWRIDQPFHTHEGYHFPVSSIYPSGPLVNDGSEVVLDKKELATRNRLRPHQKRYDARIVNCRYYIDQFIANVARAHLARCVFASHEFTDWFCRHSVEESCTAECVQRWSLLPRVLVDMIIDYVHGSSIYWDAIRPVMNHCSPQPDHKFAERCYHYLHCTLTRTV